MEVLANHPASLLRPEHFVALRINWQDKVSNIREIAAELGIGIDSLVFMDDSEFECNLVRTELPQVTTVHLPPEPASFRSVLQGLGLFDTFTLTEEDRKRSSMYRAEGQRAALKQVAGSIDDYLRSLDMVLTIERASEQSIPRIAQLTQKTNQFNLTTRRYTESDIRQLADAPNGRVYCAQLQDRFDNSGTIAVAIVRMLESDAVIDTLLMSCRVIGRGVEEALLAHIASEMVSEKCSRIVGEYIPTAKNALVSEFYKNQGFARISEREGSSWEKCLTGDLPAAPDWFNIVVLRSETR